MTNLTVFGLHFAEISPNEVRGAFLALSVDTGMQMKHIYVYVLVYVYIRSHFRGITTCL